MSAAYIKAVKHFEVQFVHLAAFKMKPEQVRFRRFTSRTIILPGSFKLESDASDGVWYNRLHLGTERIALT